jgi:hypothetical protein
MLIQGFGDMKLRLIFEQFYEALTSEIINKGALLSANLELTEWCQYASTDEEQCYGAWPRQCLCGAWEDSRAQRVQVVVSICPYPEE